MSVNWTHEQQDQGNSLPEHHTTETESNDKELEHLFTRVESLDETWKKARNAVRDCLVRLPPKHGLKVTIGKCSVNDGNHLLYKGRRWVPQR